MRAVESQGTVLRTSIGLCALLVLWGCGAGAGRAQSGPPPGETITCGGSDRLVLDCSSEVSYQGLSGEAGITVFDVAGMEGKFEQKAIRRVSEEVKQYITLQTRACRDYNACILTAEQYRGQAAEVRRKLTTVPVLLEALKSSKTDAERQRALDELYRSVVPDDKRVEEITFNMTMSATLLPTLGGETLIIPPGGPVPSGAKVSFGVSVSKDAHVYMFQTTPTGQIAGVLFPDPRIGTQNPLRAGSTQRIPDAGKSFKLNSNDLGTENIYLVVSHEPIDDLNDALNKVKAEEVSTPADHRLLQRVASVVPRSDGCRNTRAFDLVSDSPKKDGCSLGRGLELDESDASSSRSVPPADGMAVRTAPGDGLIVRVFPFNHVTLQKYRQLSQLRGTTPEQATSGTRGAVVQPTGPPPDLTPVIRRHYGALSACMTPEQLGDDGIKLRIRLRLAADGSFREPQITSSEPISPRSKQCLYGVIRRMRLAGYKGPSSLVTVPLWLVGKN